MSIEKSANRDQKSVFRCVALSAVVIMGTLISREALAIDAKQLSANLHKQAQCIKDHRRTTGRLQRLADKAKWTGYQNAEKQYVTNLKKTYALQRHTKKLPQALEVLDAASKEYRVRVSLLLRSLNIEGATVGKTRYGPLDEFDAVLKAFVVLRKQAPIVQTK